MSNNLRQIAKDLRSFVKRCKDVHYSDSLLISFLITGLLTIAPKLHADVASEQQEITAQTYDAITDLRQSFMRARKENEKSLKGAQSELVQLLKQGDQVIKSPWASFQFGTGFTNNDWGTTYRGRGGKYLEYYRRDNDLTKYVFDKDKHLYGATNLNIPRNQEPNSLTINPANVHEPYKPYVPERLDNINMPKEVVFDPALMFPTTVIPYIDPTNNPTASRSYAFELKEFENKADYEGAIVELLDEHDIDLVCLAGYMKIVGPTLLAAYEGRIINIHPAYLPEFPGAHGIEDAWNAGVDQSGVTIHWVDSGVDTGKVIKQVRVPRLEGDTLDTFETRIHETEYKLYPEVLDVLGVERK